MGLFTPLYMKGDLSVNQARKAIAMVEKITDQAKLAEIAREGKERTVRTTAIDKLNDGMLLVDFALNDKDVDLWAISRLEKLRDAKAMAKLLERHPKLEREYIERAMDSVVTDQALLEHLAKTAVHDSVRVRAIERLKSQAALGEVARHDASVWVRQQATWRLTDPDLLAKIALEDRDTTVRTAAIGNENMTDGALLAKLALKDRDPKVRNAAVHNKHLTDSRALAEYALHEPVDTDRLDALNYHTLDDEALKRILRETDDPSLRGDAITSNIRSSVIGQLNDPELLAEIALTSDDAVLRFFAVRNTAFTDQEKLAQVALQDDWADVGKECFEKNVVTGKDRITDPVLIRRIALEAAHPNTRYIAVNRLGQNDAALLEQIAMQDVHDLVRKAAILNTGLRDEDALFRIATAAGDAAYIPSRIEAALKLSRRDPGRAVAPLVALLKEERKAKGSLLIGLRYPEAARFLMKYCAENADPEADALIASLPDDSPLTPRERDEGIIRFHVPR